MTAVAPTPTRRRGIRVAVWAGVVAAFLLIALVGSALAGGGWSARATLDPESAGPDGARAIARVLTDRGVDLRIVRDLGAARSAVGPETTLVLPDAPTLTDDEVDDLVRAAGDVVLLEPRSRMLRLLLPGSSAAGVSDDTPVAAACTLPAARAAGEIAPGDLYEPGTDVEGCYPVGDAFGLLAGETGGVAVTAVDGRTLLANDTVASGNNASLALGLLGSRDRVVWYMPTLDDGEAGAPTLGELTPGWVTPSIVLLAAAAVAAGVWRGRRFGPLVTENLPVSVRVDETTVGRGRLYARAGDAAHAADQLRLAALGRLARRVGLAPTAPASDVVAAVAALLGSDPRPIRDVLVEHLPATDRELVALSDRLRDLEAAVRAAAGPERKTS